MTYIQRWPLFFTVRKCSRCNRVTSNNAYTFVIVSEHPFLHLSIPQNDLDDPERGMIFVCSATHKTKSMFFFLAQTEQGDIFKVTLETDEEMVSKDEGGGGCSLNQPL